MPLLSWLSSADFFKINFLEKNFRNINGVSNKLDPDQDCSGSKLSAKAISSGLVASSKERVLSHGIASGSVIVPCNKIDKQLNSSCLVFRPYFLQ